jgi:hypothetical protein
MMPCSPVGGSESRRPQITFLHTLKSSNLHYYTLDTGSHCYTFIHRYQQEKPIAFAELAASLALIWLDNTNYDQ